MDNMKEKYDEKNGYCRMLGHTLAFRYCRMMNDGLPCHNILNCWFERCNIEAFMSAHYSEKELKTIFQPPTMKITTMLDAVNKVAENP